MSTALAALRRIVAHVEATDNYMPGWRAWLGTLHEHAAELAEHPVEVEAALSYCASLEGRRGIGQRVTEARTVLRAARRAPVLTLAPAVLACARCSS